MPISAKVVLKSSSAGVKPITTVETRYPKFIHQDIMTHRAFSRNASSARAVPTAKLIAEVRSDHERAQPIFWGKNQPGMQAAEELDEETAAKVQAEWRNAALYAADRAERMAALGAHKQIVNRVMEPFFHINTVITATEWDNYFGLRLHSTAQPEIYLNDVVRGIARRGLAAAMWFAMQDAKAIPNARGAWHLPYCTLENGDGVAELDLPAVRAFVAKTGMSELETVKRVSVARCARVSYRSFETGKRSTVEEDLLLFERLQAQGHWSPFEHQATPDVYVKGDFVGSGGLDPGYWSHADQHGNFVGWRQLRKMMPGEAVAPLPEEYRR